MSTLPRIPVVVTVVPRFTWTTRQFHYSQCAVSTLPAVNATILPTEYHVSGIGLGKGTERNSSSVRWLVASLSPRTVTSKYLDMRRHYWARTNEMARPRCLYLVCNPVASAAASFSLYCTYSCVLCNSISSKAKVHELYCADHSMCVRLDFRQIWGLVVLGM